MEDNGMEDNESMIGLIDPPDEVIHVPITISFLIITVYVSLGNLLVFAWTGWTWITNSTDVNSNRVTIEPIGFGELFPGRKEMVTTVGILKVAATAVYILLGFVVFPVCFNLIVQEMKAKLTWLGHFLGIIDDGNFHFNDVQPVIAEEHFPAFESVRI